MATRRSYYGARGLSTPFYDTVTAVDADVHGDLAIYESLAPAGATILELGSGTGRLALPLAEHGFTVTGIEIAPAMLAQANAKRFDTEPKVGRRMEFIRGDMTSLNLQRTFDLVICPHFTLAHLPRGAAWRNTFAVAARHLRPGGIAAFHLPMLAFMRLPGPENSTDAALDEPTPSGGRLRLYIREREFDVAQGKLDQIIEYVEFDARGQMLRQSLERLTYYGGDPTPMAAPEGLTIGREPIRLGENGEIHVFLKA